MSQRCVLSHNHIFCRFERNSLVSISKCSEADIFKTVDNVISSCKECNATDLDSTIDFFIPSRSLGTVMKQELLRSPLRIYFCITEIQALIHQNIWSCAENRIIKSSILDSVIFHSLHKALFTMLDFIWIKILSKHALTFTLQATW